MSDDGPEAGRWLPLVLGAALVAALGLWAARSRSDVARGAPAKAKVVEHALASGRPTTAPGPGGEHPRRSEPTMPTLSPGWRREVTERVRAADHPGADAFRAVADLYVDHNADFARAQAEAEGLTLPEVRELTHLGLLVLATQRTPEVEEVLGHDLDDAARAALGELMRASNDDFKRDLRALVAAGRPEAERWQLIRATEARYLARFVAVTGLDADQLDALLGGNILLPGAPVAGPPTPTPDHDHPRDTSPTPPPRPSRP